MFVEHSFLSLFYYCEYFIQEMGACQREYWQGNVNFCFKGQEIYTEDFTLPFLTFLVVFIDYMYITL